MAVPVLQIDAFTDTAFAGNPAAVCLLDAPREDRWYQAVAREMNLSETAFLVPIDEDFSLRWFTPAVEVDLCGHATLASAHALWESGRLDAEAKARFHTRSGILVARRAGDWIVMDFPSLPPAKAEPPAGFLAALRLENARWIGRSRFDFLVELEDEAAVRALRPRFDDLARVDARGVIVTARADGDGDFVSRFFAPAAGVNEDPVTGSAHCVLGPYWAPRLGRGELLARQVSARGGRLRLRVGGAVDGVAPGRVELGGSAVTVLRGELLA